MTKTNWTKSLLIIFLAIVCAYVPTMGIYVLAEGDSMAPWKKLHEERLKQKDAPVKSENEITSCMLANGVQVDSPLEAFSTSDPIEPFNRAMFDVHTNVSSFMIKKVGAAYEMIVPEFIRNRLYEFSENISMPIRFINNLLQGKILNAFKEVGRFLINTALGLGGLFDTSSSRYIDLKAPPKEDFSQTLGHWGVGAGIYMVVPLIGPTNARDFVGYIGNMLLDPLTYFRDVVPGMRAFLTFNELMVGDKGRRYVRSTEIVSDAYHQQKTLQDLLSTALACQ